MSTVKSKVLTHPIPTEDEIINKAEEAQRPDLTSTVFAYRRDVFRDTVSRLSKNSKTHENYIYCGAGNLARWELQAENSQGVSAALLNTVQVFNTDSLTTAGTLSKISGRTYATLNEIDYKRPGGAVEYGIDSKEEDIYRRSDCWLSVLPDEREYSVAMQDFFAYGNALLITNEDLDYDPVPEYRVCIKSKQSDQITQSYKLLDLTDIFLFHELKSSAPDLRELSEKIIQVNQHEIECQLRIRIKKQLLELIKYNIKHVVLNDFGCGAFENDPELVASIYHEEIIKFADQFDSIAFAVPGANYQVFSDIMRNKIRLGKSALPILNSPYSIDYSQSSGFTVTPESSPERATKLPIRLSRSPSPSPILPFPKIEGDDSDRTAEKYNPR